MFVYICGVATEDSFTENIVVCIVLVLSCKKTFVSDPLCYHVVSSALLSDVTEQQHS